MIGEDFTLDNPGLLGKREGQSLWLLPQCPLGKASVSGEHGIRSLPCTKTPTGLHQCSFAAQSIGHGVFPTSSLRVCRCNDDHCSYSVDIGEVEFILPYNWLITFIASLAFLVHLMITTLRRKAFVEDVTLEHGCTIVKTRGILCAHESWPQWLNFV